MSVRVLTVVLASARGRERPVICLPWGVVRRSRKGCPQRPMSEALELTLARMAVYGMLIMIETGTNVEARWVDASSRVR